MEKKNNSIGCSVSNCAYHCSSENYCSLDKIKVGGSEPEPKSCACTECDSFKPNTTK